MNHPIIKCPVIIDRFTYNKNKKRFCGYMAEGEENFLEHLLLAHHIKSNGSKEFFASFTNMKGKE